MNVEVHESGFVSDVEYPVKWGGTSYLKENGLYFSTGASDAFLFSDTAAEDFRYSATFTPENASAQAAALVFGVSGNYTGYWVVTADTVENKLKLWRSGVGDLAVCDYYFKPGEKFTLSVTVLQGAVKVFVNGSNQPGITCELDEYQGGKVGLNVYNAAVTVNNVTFTDMESDRENGLYLGDCEVYGVLNLTDAGAVLRSDDYYFTEGVFELTDEYLLTLYGRTTYRFKINTSVGSLEYSLRTSFASVGLMAAQETVFTDETLSLSLSRDTIVNSISIGGKKVQFTQNGRTLTISEAELAEAELGSTVLTVYSTNGRAETQIILAVRDMTAVNNSKTASIVSLVVVLVLIAVGMGSFLIITHRKRKVKEKGKN